MLLRVMPSATADTAGHIWIFYYSNAKRLAVCCHENIKCELRRSGWAGLNLAIVDGHPFDIDRRSR